MAQAAMSMGKVLTLTVAIKQTVQAQRGQIAPIVAAMAVCLRPVCLGPATFGSSSHVRLALNRSWIHDRIPC